MEAEDQLPPVDRIVGADPEQGVVFVLDPSTTRRPRPRDPPGPHLPRAGALGHVGPEAPSTRSTRADRHPDGSPDAGPVPLQAAGHAQGAARDHDRAAARPGRRQEARCSRCSAPTRRRPPRPCRRRTCVRASEGDLVAAASRLRRHHLRDPGQEPAALDPPLDGHPRECVLAVRAPPLRRAGRRQAADVRPLRLGHSWRIDLPGPAAVASRRPLRPVAAGPSGRGRTPPGSSTSATGGSRRHRSAAWGTICPPSRPQHPAGPARPDVVALDMADKGFAETGRVEGGASDLGFRSPGIRRRKTISRWRPTSSPGRCGQRRRAATVYLQVSSSQNPTWATELSEKLRAAGLPAAVLTPKREEEAYRGVLGPYATREQAEEPAGSSGCLLYCSCSGPAGSIAFTLRGGQIA